MEEILRKIMQDIISSQLKTAAEEIKKLNEIPEVLTLHETALLLRTSDDWVRRNLETYRIPYFKTGSDYKFRKKQLLDWVDNNIEILSKYKMKKCS